MKKVSIIFIKQGCNLIDKDFKMMVVILEYLSKDMVIVVEIEGVVIFESFFFGEKIVVFICLVLVFINLKSGG